MFKFFVFIEKVSDDEIFTLKLISFLRQHQLMVFPLSLNGSKSPEVSRTLLSILADLDSAVVCMVSTRVLISNFQFFINVNPFTNPSARVGYDTRSIFKRSLTGLNSEFSFS